MSTTRSRPGAASSRLGRIPLSSSSAGRPVRNVVRLALHPASRTPVSPNHPIAAPTQDPLADLHDALRRTGARLPDLHRTATMLRHHPGLLRSSLALLEHSDEALADVAERSYLHPNGFAKIVLKVGGGYGIRLHVWHRQGGEWISDANPHGHRWEFASWIVVGALRETTFAELTHGKTHLRCDYDRDERGVGFLTPTRTADLRVVDRIDRRAGTVYQRSRNVVHTVTPMGRDLVASVVLQGPRAFEPTPVYLQPGEDSEHREEQLRPGRLRDLVAEVASAV
jgi:hypothetical protein